MIVLQCEKALLTFFDDEGETREEKVYRVEMHDTGLVACTFDSREAAPDVTMYFFPPHRIQNVIPLGSYAQPAREMLFTR